MTVVDDKQSTVNTDFEQCRADYREASGDMLHALYEHGTEEQTKTFYESLTLMHEQIEAINGRIKAAKRKERMNEIGKRMPKEGDEVLVDICPCPGGDCETWMVAGRVLLTWFTDKPAKQAVWAVIEISRSLTDEENDEWQSDDSWNRCKFVCRLSYDGEDWRAVWPANDIAREQWGCEEQD